MDTQLKQMIDEAIKDLVKKGEVEVSADGKILKLTEKGWEKSGLPRPS